MKHIIDHRAWVLLIVAGLLLSMDFAQAQAQAQFGFGRGLGRAAGGMAIGRAAMGGFSRPMAARAGGTVLRTAPAQAGRLGGSGIRPSGSLQPTQAVKAFGRPGPKARVSLTTQKSVKPTQPRTARSPRAQTTTRPTSAKNTPKSDSPRAVAKSTTSPRTPRGSGNVSSNARASQPRGTAKPAPSSGNHANSRANPSSGMQGRLGASKIKDPIKIRNDGASTRYLRTMRKSDHSQWTNTQKGRLGEIVADKTLRRAGYRKLPSKLPGNRGIDGIHVRNINGKPNFIVVEMKYNRFGKLRLNQTKTMGKQGSDTWFRSNVEQLTKSTNPKLKATGKMLQDAYKTNPGSIQSKAGVLNSSGRVAWKNLP